MSDSHPSHAQSNSPLAVLGVALGALGVVYGDIGTSPLYAVREIFFGHAHLAHTTDNVLGVISIIFWALTLIVSFKYVAFVLRADNKGEGGVFALLSLLQKYDGKAVAVVGWLLLLAAGLLFGDGIITPAISVVSAVEGLTVVTSVFEPYVVPITLVILTGLFVIQSKGTHSIGKLFGPVILIWFACLAAIGVEQIAHAPHILWSLNPVYAMRFLVSFPVHTIFLVLGSVMLVVTGGEAMYADMGHFGRTPIRISWFLVAYPALVLNYLGQGAFLLTNPEFHEGNLFFSMIPNWALLPMVLLATGATVIASQALITGAFSLASQAVALNLFPYLKTIHTHHEHEGQIYVPFINWLLWVGCLALVVTFKTSSNLASAYGLAVSGVMLVTTLGMIGVARKHWNWPKWQALLLFVPLVLIDAVFVSSNSLKFFEGGYLPLVIGVAILGIMITWRWGYEKIQQGLSQQKGATMQDLVELRKKATTILPRTMVLISPYPVDEALDSVPMANQVMVDRLAAMPQHILFLYIKNEKTPRVSARKRYEVYTFFKEKRSTIQSVVARFGFMENPDIGEMMRDLDELDAVLVTHNPKTWVFHELRGLMLPAASKNTWTYLRRLFFKFLYQNTDRLEETYGLDEHMRLSLHYVPLRLE